MMSKYGMPTLPAELAAKKYTSDLRWGPTLANMRYGSPKNLEQRTEASRKVAGVADAIMRTTQQALARHWAIMGDPSMNEQARYIRSAQHVQSMMKEANGWHEQAMLQVEQASEALSARASSVLKHPTDGTAALLAEAREFLRHQPGDVLLKKIKENPLYARAVATAPAELTGAAPTTHEIARRAWMEHADPELAADIDDLKAANETLSKSWSAMKEDINGAIDIASAGDLLAAVKLANGD